MTREAYQPAITNVGGSCAPLVQTASDPMNAAADRANESLIWAAVVSRFWGTQVEKFNQKVDEITAALAAQGPNYGVVVPMGPPSPGSPPDTSTEDIADAKAAAEAEAKRKWWEAHGTYVQDGGERAASMLQGGPTGANLATARDAGALPPMAVDAWGMFVKGLQGKIDPVTDRGLPGLGLWGVGAASGPAGWLQSWGEKLKTGRFAPRDPVTGRFVSFKGTPWWRQSIRALDDANWAARPGQSAANVRSAKGGTALKAGGAVLGFASGGWDQWTRDADRTDLTDTAKVTRAATRGAATAAGGYAGAWAGAQVGGAIGTAIGGPVGTVVGGALGGIIGGVIGSGVGNVVADWTVDAAGAAADATVEYVDDRLDDAGEFVEDVGDVAEDVGDTLKFW